MLYRTQKTQGQTVVGHVTTLSISWLNKRFCAVAMHKGAVVGSWENPDDIEGTNHFQALLGEAIQRTGYRGSSLTLVLAHQRLVHQLVEAPLVQGDTLSKVVQRQAKQQKVFTGEAVYDFQLLPPNNEVQRVIMHLFPRVLLTQLLQAASHYGLNLRSVIPVSALLQHQISQLTGDKENVVLITANTHGTTTLVVGRFDGQTFLIRALPNDWADAARFTTDAVRTASFVNQQFGVVVNRLYLFGQGADERVREVGKMLQPPAALSPIPYDPFYWATTAVSLREGMYPNLISPELREAPRRRVFAKVVAGLTLLLVFAALAVSAWFLIQSFQQTKDVASLSAQLERQRARQEELAARNKELARRHEIARLVIDERPSPVPAWFLAYLGEATPSDLVITNLQVKRDASLWRVTIGGTFQAAPENLSGVVNEEKALAQFRDRLSGSPFFVRFFNSANGRDTRSAGSLAQRPPGTTWLDWISRTVQANNPLAPAKKATPSPSKAAPPVKSGMPLAAQKGFLLEGIMQ